MNWPCLRETAEGTLLAVKVQPRASRTQLAGVLGQELKIAVTAPPVDSAANQALLEFLAEQIDCPRGAIKLVKGQTSRHKTVLIQGFNSEQVAQILGLAKR